MGALVLICHRCEFRHRPCNGACPCLAEHSKPVDIIERAKSRYCPKGKFPASSDDEIAQQVTIQQAAAQAKRGGCCSGGENAG
jgi:hypothetical protein